MSDVLLTAEEVAAEVGVAPATIYVWVSRGAISPVDKRGRLNLFRLSDAFEAERTRKRKHRRRKAA